VYCIGILKDSFGKKNLKFFKRFCVIVLILMDFKRLYSMGFLQSTFLNQDFMRF